MEGWDGSTDKEDEHLETAVLALTDTPKKAPKAKPFKVRNKPTDMLALTWLANLDANIRTDMDPEYLIDYSEFIDGYSQDRQTAYIYTLIGGRYDVHNGDVIIMFPSGERVPFSPATFSRRFDIV